jgi:hypothetical protein
MLNAQSAMLNAMLNTQSSMHNAQCSIGHWDLAVGFTNLDECLMLRWALSIGH